MRVDPDNVYFVALRGYRGLRVGPGNAYIVAFWGYRRLGVKVNAGKVAVSDSYGRGGNNSYG